MHHESDDDVIDSTMDSYLPLTKEEIEEFRLLSSNAENDDGLVQSDDTCEDEIKDIRLRTIGPDHNSCGSERKDDEDDEFCLLKEEEDSKRINSNGKELEWAVYQNDLLLFRLERVENDEVELQQELENSKAQLLKMKEDSAAKDKK